MRAVVQRVSKASVTVDGKIVGKIGKGLMVLLGVGQDDTQEDISYMVNKIVNLRVFTDAGDKMNLSTLDIGSEILVVSQFTLYGDCRKGNRPSYEKAARPEMANELYEGFVKALRDKGITVQTGVFQAMMDVEIHNNGPVTLMIDSKKTF